MAGTVQDASIGLAATVTALSRLLAGCQVDILAGHYMRRTRR
jgi:hypothetical protein